MKVTPLCPTLHDPIDYTVHSILQAKILVWIAFPFSRGSSKPRDRTQVSHIAGRFFTSWSSREDFNSDDYSICYCGQESFRRNGVALIAKQKSMKCRTWVQSQKQKNDLSLFPRQTIQFHSNPNLCPNYQCWRSWSWQVLWRPTTLSRTNIKKWCSFLHRMQKEGVQRYLE